MPQDDYIGVLAASGRHRLMEEGGSGSGQRWEGGLPEGAKWFGRQDGARTGSAGRGMWRRVDWGSCTVGRRTVGTPLDGR